MRGFFIFRAVAMRYSKRENKYSDYYFSACFEEPNSQRELCSIIMVSKIDEPK